MSNGAFVLPAEVEIHLTNDDFSMAHEGDVHLEQTLGRQLGDVRAGGELVLALEKVTGTLRAGGRLITDGVVEADTLHGAEVHLSGQSIKARAISADERIVIGAAKLAVDVIIAPEIHIDPDASGRVVIIESHNERGPTKIKGGFSLKEYEEVFGEAEAFLSERGVSPLGEASGEPVAAVAAPAKASKAKSKAKKASPPESEPEVAPAASAAPADNSPPPGATILPEPEDDEEDVDDPQSLNLEDLEPIVELEPDDDELHPKLLDAVRRIIACYEGKEVPPAVQRLDELIENRNYGELRDSITELWNGLLSYHQKKSLRPHHQVTHAFNVIHGLVQQA